MPLSNSDIERIEKLLNPLQTQIADLKEEVNGITKVLNNGRFVRTEVCKILTKETVKKIDTNAENIKENRKKVEKTRALIFKIIVGLASSGVLTGSVAGVLKGFGVI